MTLPSSASRLSSIAGGFVPWRKAVERLLADLDARLARSTSTAGTIVMWAGGTLPPGLLAANGTVVNRDDYPSLFEAIGTAYNTGGEAATQFRLPNPTPGPTVGSWAIRT